MTKAEFLEQLDAFDDDELGMVLRKALTDWLRTKADAEVGAHLLHPGRDIWRPRADQGKSAQR